MNRLNFTEQKQAQFEALIPEICGMMNLQFMQRQINEDFEVAYIFKQLQDSTFPYVQIRFDISEEDNTTHEDCLYIYVDKGYLNDYCYESCGSELIYPYSLDDIAMQMK